MKKRTIALLLLLAICIPACGKVEDQPQSTQSLQTTQEGQKQEETAEQSQDQYTVPIIKIVSVSDELPQVSGDATYKLSEYFDAKKDIWTYGIVNGTDEVVDLEEVGQFVDGDYADTSKLASDFDNLDKKTLAQEDYDTYFEDSHSISSTHRDIWEVVDSDNEKVCVMAGVLNLNELNVYVKQYVGTIYQDGQPYENLLRTVSFVCKDTSQQEEFIKEIYDLTGVKIEVENVTKEESDKIGQKRAEEAEKKANTSAASSTATAEWDFFPIKQVASIDNKVPENTYLDDTLAKSNTEDIEKLKENGYDVYVDTWHSVDEDVFPYHVYDSLSFTKNGETFVQMVERVGTSMQEMFAKESLYAGHENECCYYKISEDGKRACIVYYDAKEKVAYAMILTHVAHKDTKKGTEDYYMTSVTGEHTNKIASEDEFYKNLEALGIYF